MSLYPLWLPKGSIRAILALSMVGSSIYGLLSGRLEMNQFLTITSIVTAFYFTTRAKE